MCSVFTFSKGGGKLIFSISGDDPLPAHLELILTTLSGRQINPLAQSTVKMKAQSSPQHKVLKTKLTF
jgi:hypothetical protein